LRWSLFADLARQAWEGLFPDKSFEGGGTITYSDRFKGFNANGRRRDSFFCFNLSKQWRRIDPNIQVGLIQELMLRLLKKKGQTVNIEIYHHFLRSVHLAVPKLRADPILLELFNKVNEEYFNGTLDQPNLVWGTSNLRKIGSYDFGSDEIRISSSLHPNSIGDRKLVEYVLYHEMLHKKHKFHSANGRVCSHSPAFRREERMFRDAKVCEMRLKQLHHPMNSLHSVQQILHPFAKLLEAVRK